MLNIRHQLFAAYRRGRRIVNQLAGTDYPLNRIPRSDLARIIARNRSALAEIPQWVDEQTLRLSIFNYGITPQFLPTINQIPGPNCTYADLLVYFGERLRKPLRYLELGVSVGKTFWQVLSSSQRAQLVGFDIETINPALEKRLLRKDQRQWPAISTSMKKTPTTLTTYQHTATQSEVNYLCGDVFDPQAWRALAGTKFNLVFSDAFHSIDALQKEWDMIRAFELLDPSECVMVWDDLDGPMHEWFVGHRHEIAATIGAGPRQVCTLLVNGWMGGNECPHRIGVAMRGNFFKASSNL